MVSKSKDLNLKMKSINYKNKYKSVNKSYKNSNHKDTKSYRTKRILLMKDQRNKKHNTVCRHKKVMMS